MNVGDLVRLNPSNSWSQGWVDAGLLDHTYEITSLDGDSGIVAPVIRDTVVGPGGQTVVHLWHVSNQVIPV